MYVCRFEKKDGEKDIRPLTLWRTGGKLSWQLKSLPKPRPLYGLDQLAARPNAPVLVVEGEKAADAAAAIFPEYVVTTSPGGSSSAASAGWSPLNGRDVVVWPDHDEAGAKYARDVARLARNAGAASVRLVSVPADWPPNWDLADDLPEGVALDDLRRMVADAVEPEPAPVPAAEPDPEAARTRQLLDQLWHPVGLDLMTSSPPARLWLFRDPDGTGRLPRGRAGILAAEGGAGKTHALFGAAVAVACGRPWLDHFRVPEDQVGGSVLLLLGEEDEEENHRRLWRLASVLNLSQAERTACAEKIVAVPLAGYSLQLTEVEGGQVVETAAIGEIRRRLDGGKWSLIGIDPLSRFAGGDVESSNEAATRFMQVIESLCRAPGNPTVLVATHSSKLSRRQGGADVRGVTGLTDAARYVATLRTEGDVVVFEQAKSNYSMPMSPVRLQWREGVLDVLSAADQAVADEHERSEQVREIDEDVAAIVEALQREGTLTSRDAIAHAAGLRLQRGRAAIDIAGRQGVDRPGRDGQATALRRPD